MTNFKKKLFATITAFAVVGWVSGPCNVLATEYNGDGAGDMEVTAIVNGSYVISLPATITMHEGTNPANGAHVRAFYDIENSVYPEIHITNVNIPSTKAIKLEHNGSETITLVGEDPVNTFDLLHKFDVKKDGANSKYHCYREHNTERTECYFGEFDETENSAVVRIIPQFFRINNMGATSFIDYANDTMYKLYDIPADVYSATLSYTWSIVDKPVGTFS